MYEKKAWGFAKHIFSSPNCAVSILNVETGGYSSRHKHLDRVNRFVVSTGVIDVVEYTEDGKDETSRKTLKAGDLTDVQAGVVHRFEVVESGIVVEVYWPATKFAEVMLTDIHRLDEGGKHVN
jgi:quercetin dioxygenase-like cupin family protein